MENIDAEIPNDSAKNMLNECLTQNLIPCN